MGCSDSKSTGTENTTSKPDNNKEVGKEANNVGGEMSEEKKKAILQMR